MRAAFVFVIFCITGCGNDLCAGIDGACIDLTVEGDGTIDGLRITMSGAHSREVVAPQYPKRAGLPVHLALQLNGGGGVTPIDEHITIFKGGAVHLLIVAIDAGKTVGRGEADLELGARDHRRLTINLGAGGAFDLALAANTDLSGQPGDLGAPSDLPGSSDLCSPNVFNDPANCGRCGHNCLGGACLDGECQPVVIASMLSMPFGVAVDANFIYFTGQLDGLKRVPLTGGAPAAFGMSMGTRALTLFGASLYYGIESPLAGIAQVVVADGTTTGVGVGGLAGPMALAGAGSKLYFVNGSDNKVRSVDLPLSGPSATPTDVATLPATGLRGIATDGTTLYVSAFNLGRIYAVLIGSTTSTLIANVLQPAGLAVDGSTLWVCSSQGLHKMDLMNPGSPMLMRSGNLSNVAADATSVVYVDTTTRQVLRLAK